MRMRQLMLAAVYKQGTALLVAAQFIYEYKDAVASCKRMLHRSIVPVLDTARSYLSIQRPPRPPAVAPLAVAVVAAAAAVTAGATVSLSESSSDSSSLYTIFLPCSPFLDKSLLLKSEGPYVSSVCKIGHIISKMQY
jgi:hypothetical protein